MANGNSTAMAGEFHVMSLLYRLGHEPALTLGNAKSVDILTVSPEKNTYRVSVKSVCAGGKWPIGSEDYSEYNNLVFVLLIYKSFQALNTVPSVWVIPAPRAETMKKPWLQGFGIYQSGANMHPTLPDYHNAWHHLS